MYCDHILLYVTFFFCILLYKIILFFSVYVYSAESVKMYTNCKYSVHTIKKNCNVFATCVILYK